MMLVSGALLTGTTFAATEITTTAKSQAKQDAVISFKVIKESLTLKKSDIKSAKLVRNPKGGDFVLLTLTKVAAERMLQLTKNNIDHSMALVINNRIISQPVIRSAISGQLQVTFTSHQEAKSFYERLIA